MQDYAAEDERRIPFEIGEIELVLEGDELTVLLWPRDLLFVERYPSAVQAVWKLVAYWDDPVLAAWSRTHGDELRRAWERCPQPEWLLYWADHLVPRETSVRAACAVLRACPAFASCSPAMHAAAVAEAWARGDATAADCAAARPSRDAQRVDFLPMSSVDFVLRAIVDGQTGLVHNAAMRAVQASPNENGAGERYARVITASVPFERIAEALEAQGIQARGSLWDMLRPLRGEPLEVAWAHPFGDDARSAFASCDQPDWLLAMALSLGVDHRTVIRSLIRVVERAGLGPLSPEGAERLDLARTWAEGGALPSEREWAPTTSLDVAVRTIELSCRAPHLAPFAADRIRTALHAAERTTDHLAISRRVTAALRNELPAPQ